MAQFYTKLIQCYFRQIYEKLKLAYIYTDYLQLV
jgi:hypothetical protein